MLNSNEDTITDTHKNFLFSKLMFWLQFIFFGGWNGIQILLQPQDLSIFVIERRLLDNYFFTMSYTWKNIPLIYLFFFAIGVFWNYRAVSLDQKIINQLKKNNNLGVIPYKDKDDIIVFITLINVIIWIFSLWIIYLLPYWDFNFFTNLIYSASEESGFRVPLYILVILLTAGINSTLRIQLLLFYEGGFEYLAVVKFIKSFAIMKAYYFKSLLITLLATSISVLIYKQLILELFIKIRHLIPGGLFVDFSLIINRQDVLSALPSLITLFLFSCLLFSPIVIYIYNKIITSQFEFYKMQYLKEKIKKDIDENP